MSKIESFCETFRGEGFVYFDLSEFLPDLPRIAEGAERIEDRFWSAIIKNREGVADYYQDSRAAAAHELAIADYTAGRFSYSFKRLDDTPTNNRNPIFWGVKTLLSSESMFELLRQVTGRKATAIRRFYFNRFDEGEFLFTHTDPGQSFGLVLNLSKGWEPNHGGLTMVQTDDRKAIRACLVPSAFQVLIFDTSARLIPHFVSMVTARPIAKRIAVVVRYDAE
ncbi:hypothetical protein [Ensifer aridi]|uniref:hypothetical protein n=1 Tax=Ensifer aridi TaxID=1708715 RepID=UPI0015E36DCA|nr:hypothetical protein [Ensifer aridi]